MTTVTRIITFLRAYSKVHTHLILSLVYKTKMVVHTFLYYITSC